MLILGNSILEGVGTTLLIQPVYILTTMLLAMISLAVVGLIGLGAALFLPANPVAEGVGAQRQDLAARSPAMT